MFNFSKSVADLQNKNKDDIQYKVLSDWLRSIHQQNIQLSRKISVLQKTLESILENEPRQEEIDDFQDK